MNFKKGIVLFSLVLSFFIVRPVLAKNDCSTITIDNNTSDWESISALLTDDEDITGIVYYYNGSSWSTTASDDDLYSTNILRMQDLETVKVCNSATQLQLYIDAYHPLLAYQDLSDETYYEFGDPSGSDGELGLPATLDMWLVFKLQNADSSAIYYYAIYLYAEEGNLGLENGPRQQAIYQESDDVKFADAAFNPNEDELLVEIDEDSSKDDEDSKESKGKDDDSDEGGKNIDASGGFETDVALMDSYENGLFNLSDIRYGDVLNFGVNTYDGTAFEASEEQSITADEAINDETEVTTYRVKRTGVRGVTVPKDERESTQVLVEWDEVADASSYTVHLLSKSGKKLRTITSEEASATISDLKRNRRYRVQVRAVVGNLYTGWSTRVEFRTTE